LQGVDNNSLADAQVISLEAERRFQEQIQLADHIAQEVTGSATNFVARMPSLAAGPTS
jgi:hypothetical protein